MDISIIIVNYNTYTFLLKCLLSITSYTKDLKYEIIVVDNNSTDRDIEQLKILYPDIKLILNNENNGFGDGCNIGAASAEGKFLLFINPDVEFACNVNFAMFKLMESDSNIAVSSPIYFEDDGSVTFSFNKFPGYGWNVAEAFANVVYRIKTKITGQEHDYKDKVFEVDWVMGSYMFIRHDVFKKVNGFDNIFFLYYEDIDLQYRIKKLGYRIVYNGFEHISHFKRSSVRSIEGENLFYYQMTRSNLIYCYKHFGFMKRNLIRGIHISGIVMRVLGLLFRRDFKNCRRQKFHQYLVKLKQYMFTRKIDVFGNV